MNDDGRPENDGETTAMPSTEKQSSFEVPSFVIRSIEIVSDHPASVLAMASVPFCAGAYFGFRSPMSSKMESLVGSSSAVTDPRREEALEADFGPLEERRRVGVRTASRALRVATLTSVGTFGMVSAGTSSCMSLP